MEEKVVDVKMYPKAEGSPAPTSLARASTSSSDSSDHALRTSAIPVPDGQLRNRNSSTYSDKSLQPPPLPEKESPARGDGSDAVDSSEPPNPDLIVLFNTPKPEASVEEQNAAQAEYSRLVTALNKAGLLTSSSPAAEGTHQRLIFVKAVQSAIRAEAQKERYVLTAILVFSNADLYVRLVILSALQFCRLASHSPARGVQRRPRIA